MLLVCAAALAAAGCSSKKLTKNQAISHYSQELREAVSSNVHDERRKSEMLSTVDQLETLQRRFSEETASFVDGYRKLNADYDAPRPAFDQLFSDYGAKRIKARNEALDLHFHLASLATDSEWGPIAKAEANLYEEVSAARPAGSTE
jgi:molecular chaperone GrpE (heat shock protein)